MVFVGSKGMGAWGGELGDGGLSTGSWGWEHGHRKRGDESLLLVFCFQTISNFFVHQIISFLEHGERSIYF